MTGRLGIELTPSRCSLLTIEEGAGGPGISDFQTIEYASGDTGELEGELRRLIEEGRFAQSARLVIWSSRALHAAMLLPADDPDRLEANAIARAKGEHKEFAGWASNTWAGVATGGTFHLEHGAPGREALFAAMSAEDVRRRIKPFQRAGFAVDTVMTPELALTGLARAVPGLPSSSVVAFVVMNRDAGALVVMQGSRLLLERRLSWDFRVEHAAVQERLAERYSFAARVAAELRPAFEQVHQETGASVSHVQLCGDLPNLRTFAMPLIAELDLEIDTMDDLPDDAGSWALVDRQEILGEQMASLQLAWAAAATAPLVRLSPPAPVESGAFRRKRIAAAGLAAAAAVALALVLWPATVAPPSEDLREVAMTQSAGEPVPDPAATTGAHPAIDAPALPPGVDDRSVGNRPLPIEDRDEEPILPEAADGREATSGPGRPGMVETPAPEPVSPAEPAPGELDSAAPTEAARDDSEPFEQGPEPHERSAADVAAAPQAPVPTFPDVRSILYSSDRRLAIVGRQVVGVGDTLGSAVVVDITRDTVVVRLPSGEEHRLTLTYGPKDRER
jgi:hypothetical protein